MDIIVLFIVGLFFANGIPHFVHGISGKKFPSPFSKPPGKGLSPSIINVLWGLTNFLVAIALYTITDGLSLGLNAGFIAFALGFVVMSFGLAIFFQDAEKDT